MTTQSEIEEKFWKALESDRTVMLGLTGLEEGHTRPMTAVVDTDGDGAIYFFTANDSKIVKSLSHHSRAVATFADKGHGLFASVHGELVLSNDRAVIDRLWNPFIAAWYEGGKDDPKLALLRFDADDAQVWLNASSITAGVQLLLGMDPKKLYRDKVARVNLEGGSGRA